MGYHRSLHYLMIAVVPLKQQSWAAPLPDVAAGDPFWAQGNQVESLIAGGLAIEAPPGTTGPPPEPAYTVNGVPGLAAGTSNASH
jgi:hypothetical protein